MVADIFYEVYTKRVCIGNIIEVVGVLINLLELHQHWKRNWNVRVLNVRHMRKQTLVSLIT